MCHFPLQGVGIAAFCLLQRRLVRGTDDRLLAAPSWPPPTPQLNEQHASSARTSRRAYGPITVTAHAYCTSLPVMLLAAAVDSALRIEERFHLFSDS